MTGASGFVGRQLVPRLLGHGHEIVVIGRDRARLAARFPAVEAGGYDEIATLGRGCDLLVHLAVLNNDARASDADFRGVNVDLFAKVLQQARLAGIPRVVNVTTFHALDGRGGAYARSKHAALAVARAATGIEVSNLFLPAVHGDDYAGKLRIVKRLPRALRPATVSVLGALAPTVHVDRLADYLSRGAPGVAGEDIVLADPKVDNPAYRIARTLLDLMFVVVVFGLLWWLLAIVWVAVRAGSEGPGILAQERVGRHGRSFTCYKFRTMKQGTIQAGTHEVAADSVTAVGAFLRRYKLDELPQAWNVARGEMSLIGPRPCLPSQAALVEARRRRGVLEVPQGITGLAQVNGIDMSDPETLARWDECYVRRQSLALDLKIILRTIAGRGNGDRVRGG
ncbi:MAG: sugar transferase [Rhodobacteraceae bacterium]|nr:sugar transferase [Paracoccaceae bacterium]